MIAREHGDRARYKAGCRCTPCRSANSAYEDARYREKAYGRPTSALVDAGPARDHVRALIGEGLGTRRIASRAGVSRPQVQALLRGRPDRGTGPTRRIRRETAEALMSVDLESAHGALLDASGVRRRLQALMAAGWTLAAIARRGDTFGTWLCQLLVADRVTASTARKVATLYDELWDEAPPESTPRERSESARARARALRRGWRVPMAWDDELIDLPEADLAEEVRRRVLAMDPPELAAASRAVGEGERSIVLVAAAREVARRSGQRSASGYRFFA